MSAVTDKGKWVEKKTAEIFELTIGTKLNADNVSEPVYQLRNRQHYWEGTEKQFREQFERL